MQKLIYIVLIKIGLYPIFLFVIVVKNGIIIVEKIGGTYEI